MIQAGCVHRLFDAAARSISRRTPTPDRSPRGRGNSAATNLSPASFANGYFNLGIITFISGVLEGASMTVSTSVSATGVITTIMPFATAPAPGDDFTIIPGCDKTFGMCGSGKFKLPSGAFGSNAAALPRLSLRAAARDALRRRYGFADLADHWITGHARRGLAFTGKK